MLRAPPPRPPDWIAPMPATVAVASCPSCLWCCAHRLQLASPTRPLARIHCQVLRLIGEALHPTWLVNLARLRNLPVAIVLARRTETRHLAQHDDEFVQSHVLRLVAFEDPRGLAQSDNKLRDHHSIKSGDGKGAGVISNWPSYIRPSDTVHDDNSCRPPSTRCHTAHTIFESVSARDRGLERSHHA